MNGGEFTQLVRVFMTSKDLKELAEKAEKRERETRAGDSLEFATWYCSNGDIKFVVDQGRAIEQGLMK